MWNHPAEFAEAILAILAADGRDDSVEFGRERLRRGHSLSGAAERWLACYREALGGRSGAF